MKNTKYSTPTQIKEEVRTTHTTRSAVDVYIDTVISSMSRRDRRKTQRKLGLGYRKEDFTIKKIDVIKQ